MGASGRQSRRPLPYLAKVPDSAPHIYLAGMRVAWGLWEARKERINAGIAGFALTVLAFYFSTVMDKLGRSASLIGLGLLFLAGGWLLEKARRRLVARLEKGAT